MWVWSLGPISQSGRSPGENGNSLKYFCLGNLRDRGAWWGFSPWGGKRIDTTGQLNNKNKANVRKLSQESTGLTEAEDIKRRWQEYTEELYKRDLNDSDNHDGVITHLESDILGCEVKWALGSITTNKASGGDGIPAKLFQILKDDAVKMLHWICQQIWKTAAVATRLEKVSFHSNPKERQC